MPVLCQQCGEAPCEPVCPVFATYHTDEGVSTHKYTTAVLGRAIAAAPVRIKCVLSTGLTLNFRSRSRSN
jgi:Fe-S-cluster-containing dehydrogenase component